MWHRANRAARETRSPTAARLRTSRIAGAVAIGVLLVGSGPLAAQDVSGTWVFSVDLGATGAGDATLVLVQDGDSLTGSYTGAVGEHEIHGSVRGDQIEIHFEADEVGVVRYHGTITDAGIEGTCEYGELASGTFRAKRSES